ncbi:MAG: CehA/McbA family metallohydrolase, partial [Polyangiaceae bacterium]
GPGKTKVPAESGVRISLLQKGSEVLSIAPSGTALDAEVPPGDYDVAYAGGAGRSAVGPLEHVHVEPAKTAHTTVEVSSSAKLDLACTSESGSAMPCKITFEGLEGTKDPNFGVASAAGPAKNQVTTAAGRFDALPLSPGKYRITASRGPEYALVQKETTIAAGERGSFSASLKRVVDTGSYLGCDFHQHSMLGADAPTSTRDRVISNVAEGVDVAVASEHNMVADFMPFVHELGMEGELVEIPGDEITSDAALVPWGHMNVFPLVPNLALPRGGALDPTKPPKDVLDAAAKIPYPHVVQVNHPRAWNIGYFDLAKFDPNTGTAAAPWYDDRFDAIEIWNGRNVESRDKVRADYFSLLLHGHVVTATANTDTHGVVGQEAGYPRTYVRVADAQRPLAWNDQRTQDLVKGIVETRDTILTNGPFLEVDVNGAGIGGVATAKNGSIRIHVVVQAAPWVSIDHVGFALASGPTREKDITAKPNARGAMEATADFSLAVKKDDAIVIYAKGDKPLTPVLSGTPPEIAPYAMTGAIWIDANGDGVALGRKKK